MRIHERDRVAAGRRAEEIAAKHLEGYGFRLLWKNVRIGPLEIDLVMKRDDLAVIVEVRSRRRDALIGPLASVSFQKQRALLRAARGIWRGRLKKMPDIQRVRIDVVAITRDAETTHVEWVQGALSE